MGPIYHVSQRGRSSVENSALHPVSGAKCSNHYLFVHSLPLLLANVVVFHQNDGPTVTCPIMRRLSKSYQMFFFLSLLADFLFATLFPLDESARFVELLFLYVYSLRCEPRHWLLAGWPRETMEEQVARGEKLAESKDVGTLRQA